MTETTTPAPTTPKVKKAAKAKKPSTHPGYSEMIKQAITSLGEKSGSSRQAIVKYILKNFKLEATEKAVSVQTKMALRRGVASGLLKQSKGTGASGSFKIGAAKKEEKKPKAKKASKTKVKRPKSLKVKKPKAAKPKAAKPKAAKPKAAKPKAAKPKTAKPQKSKSPKKVAAKKVTKAKKAKIPKKAAAKK